MWVRTQDKKELVNVIKFEISSIFGDKKNKVVIFGRFGAESLFTSNRTVLGKYATREDAIAEIDEIEKYIVNNPNGVYDMSDNK